VIRETSGAPDGAASLLLTVLATDGMARSETVTLEFRYPSAGGGSGDAGGGGGGGGRLEWLTLLLLLGVLVQTQHLALRRARR